MTMDIEDSSCGDCGPKAGGMKKGATHVKVPKVKFNFVTFSNKKCKKNKFFNVILMFKKCEPSAEEIAAFKPKYDEHVAARAAQGTLTLKHFLHSYIFNKHSQ